MSLIEISPGCVIGEGRPCFTIAEAGVNHNGSLELAFRLIDAAADAGADAVKFQTFRTEDLVSRDAPKADYQVKATGSGESQYEMLKRLELSPEDHKKLIEYSRDRNLLFLSTPFDAASADLLVSLEIPAFKIPSGEITNIPFLRFVAKKGKPILLSTGMSTLDEVSAAVDALRAAGASSLCLLHCVSSYPAEPISINLRAMKTMREVFNLPVGYSDHTLGTEVALASVALGACVLEKHLTLDRSLPGPDHAASLEPAEFFQMMRSLRNVEYAMGHGRKEPAPCEANTAEVARKSLIAAINIAEGEILTPDSLVIKRPGTGLSPSLYDEICGRRAAAAISAGTPLRWELLQ